MLPTVRNNSLVPTATPVNRLSSLFDRFFTDDFFSPLTTTPGWAAVPLAVWEDEHNVYVEADLPGMTDKDVEVTTHQGQLIISGERRAEQKGAWYDTRSYGRFEQRVTLPSAVEGDKAEAKLCNGVLCLTFPKREDAKPRKIPLKAE